MLPPLASDARESSSIHCHVAYPVCKDLRSSTRGCSHLKCCVVGQRALHPLPKASIASDQAPRMVTSGQVSSLSPSSPHSVQAHLRCGTNRLLRDDHGGDERRFAAPNEQSIPPFNRVR